MQKICEVGNHPFTLEDSGIEAYRRFGFEPLNICFPHQHQQRLNFRNRNLNSIKKCSSLCRASRLKPDIKEEISSCHFPSEDS